METNYLLVLCTCEAKQARLLADGLVENKLAACVNQLPAVQSTYRWQGKVEHGEETLLMIKTMQAQYNAVQDFICELHSYDCPEIIALPIEKGLPGYLQWMGDSLV